MEPKVNNGVPHSQLTTEQRIAASKRPAGMPIMHQSWDKLLFLNWEVTVDTIRPLIPEPLVIDTFDGSAWLTITPLTIWNVRPPVLPALPYLGWLHELNVRTYVHCDGVPGVWFFSLDANNLPAVLGARILFKLPYYSASISLGSENNKVSFDSKRSDGKASFEAGWVVGSRLPFSEPGSLQYFLTERYSLYTADERDIFRCRIHHRAWPLQETSELSNFKSNMFEVAEMPTPVGPPIQYCGGPVDVDVWPLEKVAERLSNTR